MAKNYHASYLDHIHAQHCKENRYTISQQLKLKENLTEADNQALLSPANYRFQVINEEELSVASFMGLEYSLLLEDNRK